MAKILVVEDNHELAASLEDMLDLSGYESEVKLTGREGLEYAFAEHPDLVILDIRLPDMTGYDVYRKIREDSSWGKDARIMILTASESIENISKNVNLPKEYVLFKPNLSIKELLGHIENRLQNP